MSTTQSNSPKQQRHIALDVLRGITIAFMCIVNNPGSWSRIFSPLRHAAWNGCTPTDLVYPFFLFCAGVSMAFSFAKYFKSGKYAGRDITDGSNRGLYLKILKRSVLLFLTGLALNMFPFFPVNPHFPDGSFSQNWIWWLRHVRIFGVLQRIAIAYMIAAFIVLWLKKPRKIILAILTLCTVYTGILLLFGKEAGPFTLEGNILPEIDMALIGENHMYHGYRYADGSVAVFDPEGLLGGLTAACNVLMGYLIGCAISRNKFIFRPLLIWGLLCLAFAGILAIFIPVNKPLWSMSYVFYSSAWAIISLGILSYFIYGKGKSGCFRVFSIMGSNALMAFVVSGIVARTLPMLGFHPSEYFGANEFMSLLWAIIFTFVIFLVQWLLYRKNINIRL